MRLSARNQITGKIRAIHKGEISSVIELTVAPGIIMSATISNDALEELNLAIGQEAIAVVKASDVMVGVSNWERGNKPVDGEPLF